MNKYEGKYQAATHLAYYTALLSTQFSVGNEHMLSFVISEKTHACLPSDYITACDVFASCLLISYQQKRHQTEENRPFH